MAVYDSKKQNYVLDDEWTYTNAAAPGRYNVSSSTGLYVTGILQSAVLGTMFGVMVYGTASSSGIIQIDDDGVIRVVVAGALDVIGTSGQALVDAITTAQTTAASAAKLYAGWYTSPVDGKKYLALLNNTATAFAAGKIELTRLG